MANKYSFEEILIEKVKNNEHLYNKNLKLYKNSIQRKLTWAKISGEIKQPIETCKQRWKSLRDRFVRENRKHDLSSGSGAADAEQWCHYQQMIFLRDNLETRAQTGNYPVKVSRKTVSIQKEESSHNPVESYVDEIISPTPEPQSMGNSEDPFSDDSFVHRSSQKPIKRRNTSIESYDFVLQGLKELVEKRINNAQEQTENELFMSIIARKLDTLPLDDQAELQLEILTIVNTRLAINRSRNM